MTINTRLMPTICLTMIPLVGAQAQSPVFKPYSGKYLVTAEYGDDMKSTWESTHTVRDTTINNVKMMTVTHHSSHKDTGGEFEATATFDLMTGRITALDGYDRGRSSQTYHLRMAEGRATGKQDGDDGPQNISAPLPVDAVPDFAAGAVLASRAIKPGDVVTIPVFTLSSNGIHEFKFVGDVKAGSITRPGGKTAEETLVVQGRAEYPMRVVIARNDGVVLEIVLPQGSVGKMTETWTR